jgi:hypothetical protein
MEHYSEITEELFYAVKHSGIVADGVVNKAAYTDLFYIIHGVLFIARTQNGYANYYIQDINA